MRIFAAAGAAAMAATAADILRTTEETFIFDISGWAWRCADVLVAKRMLRTLVRWIEGFLYKKKKRDPPWIPDISCRVIFLLSRTFGTIHRESPILLQRNFRASILL